jgi:hypothetical protein
MFNKERFFDLFKNTKLEIKGEKVRIYENISEENFI